MRSEDVIGPSFNQEEEVRYHVVRSERRRRTIAISIERDGRVVVRAPAKTPSDLLHQFMRDKSGWIRKKVLQIHHQQIHARPRAFVSGETFLYLGETYPLRVTQHQDGLSPLTFSEGEFWLNEDFKENGKELFVAWYKKEAESVIRERVTHYKEVMGIPFVDQRITSARYQWGGCYSNRRVTFSWRIVLAPLPVIDYVVVHELAHLKERNHSHKFWKLVETILPDYRVRRQWLKRNGHLLWTFR